MDFEYRTRHLPGAASFVAKNQKLIRLEKQGKVCWFIFANKEKCETLSKGYSFGKLLINAREYSEAISLLKNRIFATY